MNSENFVLFKGNKDGINIILSEDATFEQIRDQLEKKIEDAAKFFDGFKTTILFKGKTITEEQELELLNIITEKTNMNISFIQAENEETTELAAVISEQIQQHNITKFYKGAIRSGQSIEFSGSVVIIGDVNPGGVVRAEGNIIILGTLKGMVHAGCTGMTDAFVIALNMIPTQLRIADIITRFPEEEMRVRRPAEYAYIEDGQIYVVPLE